MNYGFETLERTKTGLGVWTEYNHGSFRECEDYNKVIKNFYDGVLFTTPLDEILNHYDRYIDFYISDFLDSIQLDFNFSDDEMKSDDFKYFKSEYIDILKMDLAHELDKYIEARQQKENK